MDFGNLLAEPHANLIEPIDVLQHDTRKRPLFATLAVSTLPSPIAKKQHQPARKVRQD